MLSKRGPGTLAARSAIGFFLFRDLRPSRLCLSSAPLNLSIETLRLPGTYLGFQGSFNRLHDDGIRLRYQIDYIHQTKQDPFVRMETGRLAAGSLGPRLAGRLTAELILRSPQYMNCVKDYEIDLRGAVYVAFLNYYMSMTIKEPFFV